MLHIYRVTRAEGRVGDDETGSGVVVAANTTRARELMMGSDGSQLAVEWLRPDTKVYRLGSAMPRLREQIAHQAFHSG